MEKNNKENIYDGLSREEAEILSELKTLKTSYAMYEKTKKETLRHRKNAVDKYGNKIFSDNSTEDTISLINTMQEDIKTKYLKLGGKEIELVAETKKRGKANNDERKKWILEALKKNQVNTIQENENEDITTNIEESPIYSNYDNENNNIETGNDVNIKSSTKEASSKNKQYDIIPLPSGGQCYKHKKGKIAVLYLTAYDENIILSPNLYRDGTFINKMLENKILESDVDAEDLIPGDRDAIVIWLRATGYGNEYPVKVTDNETGEKFDTVVDLSQIKFKPFKLKANKFGYFDYKLPISNDIVTFKFLSAKDIKALEDTQVMENKTLKINRVKKLTEELINLADDNDILDNLDINSRKAVTIAINTLEKNITEAFEADEEDTYLHELTDRLIASIIGINKVTDRSYIENYVYNMNVRDASALRKYMIINEPGLDYTVKVEKPESLGGGFMETFLSLDEFIFINVI